MAEFPTLGRQCCADSCNQLDFLPVICSYCKQSYCQFHSFAEKHGCTQLTNVTVEVPETSFADPALYCSVNTCKTHNLLAIICELCNKNFCIRHRIPESHSCSCIPTAPVISKPNANEGVPVGFVAKELPVGHKNKPMADRLKVMRLKQKANGEGDKIAISERIYFGVVVVEGEGQQAPEVPVYLNKDWSVGRAVDSIGKLLNIKYDAVKRGSKRLRLFTTPQCDSDLPFDRPLSAVESFNDGATVYAKLV